MQTPNTGNKIQELNTTLLGGVFVEYFIKIYNSAFYEISLFGYGRAVPEEKCKNMQREGKNKTEQNFIYARAIEKHSKQSTITTGKQ